MNHYPDGHNVGLGMVYDTPDEKEIARLNKKLTAAQQEIAALKAQLAGARDEANAAWLSHGELTHTVETLRAQLATARDDEARECAEIARVRYCGTRDVGGSLFGRHIMSQYDGDIAAAIERRIQERSSTTTKGE